MASVPLHYSFLSVWRFSIRDTNLPFLPKVEAKGMAGKNNRFKTEMTKFFLEFYRNPNCRCRPGSAGGGSGFTKLAP